MGETRRIVVAWFFRLINWLRLIGKGKHRYNVKTSKRVLKKLSNIPNEVQILAYVRKIEPDVFEEMVLSAFERDGFPVLRNKRYSGDGGIDGQVRLPGGWVPIQCKRYGRHIKKEHIEDFLKVIKKRKAISGFFVHSGKTGIGSKEALQEVLLLSGFEFAQWLAGKTESKMIIHSLIEKTQRRLRDESQSG